jgi:polygalacturonase
MKKKLSIIIAFIIFLSQAVVYSLPAKAETSEGWAMVPDILKQIVPPTFPDQDFLITDYGAIGDGTTDSTDAFKLAIEAAHNAGGGKVVVPAGEFLTGAIYLKSNVNLHVTKDATVKFSQDPQDYLPLVKTRWEGVELMNYSPLIYAYGEENIAITGEGTLDGQGDNEHWWPWKGKKEYGYVNGDPEQSTARNKLFQMAEDGVPVEERIFGEGSYLRPSFIQPYESKNILIQGVTIKDSPMWQLNPVLSENITVDNVTIIGHGPNNDGIDPESVKNMIIKNSYFDNGDDCIAIKSGRNADGRRVNVPTENIIIENNHMKDGHGGVVIGSEMSGSVRNVFARNNLMDSPNLDRALRIKTNSVRGGVVENVYLKDNIVESIGGEVILIDMYYEEGDSGDFTPIVRNIEVDNLHSKGGKYGLYIRAYDRNPVENLRIINSSFDGVRTPARIENVEDMVLKNFYINGEKFDNVAPQTTVNINGEVLSDGSYLHRAEVELNATDDGQVDHIEYKDANGLWNTYSSPLVIEEEGKTDIQYRAVDTTDNHEKAKITSVNIKKASIENATEIVNNASIKPSGIQKSILVKLRNAAKSFDSGKQQEANEKLSDLRTFIEEQPEKHIQKDTKEDLVKMIQYIISNNLY